MLYLHSISSSLLIGVLECVISKQLGTQSLVNKKSNCCFYKCKALLQASRTLYKNLFLVWISI